jgi:hypothetical protein
VSRRFVLAALAGFCLPMAAMAQNAPIIVAHPVTVGAITRDPQFYMVPNDVATIQAVRRLLIDVESDLAGRLSSMSGLSYQDRTATQELMHEVHMSSGRDFDLSTGALRGLMGRLDYLIVIDAVDRSTAKMRLIDVETGSVKGVETCVRRVANQHEQCVELMAQRLVAAGRERAGAAGEMVAARGDVMKVKPQWDDQVARYEAARAYWAKIQSQIGGAGHTLRPEIQTLLNGAGKDVSSGRFAVEHLDAPNLQVALTTLTAKLDQLDNFR